MKHISSYSLFENVQQAKSILRSLNIDQSDESFKKIRELLKGHEGYVGWFTKLFYIKKYKMNDLLELYDFIKDNSAFISMLKTNIIQYDNIEKLQDDVELIKSESQLRRVYNEFPSKQKAFIDIKKDSSLLDSLSRRKDYKGFFKKVASYHTRKELIDNLNVFLKTDPTASLDKIMNISKKNGSEIKHFSYENNILIIRVFNSSQLNDVAGDCSWCIRNSGTFQSYVGNNGKQYIIFLFDRTDNLSRIGVTMRIDKPESKFFSTAHDRRDSFVSYSKLESLLSEYEYKVSDLSYKLSDINPNTTSVSSLQKAFNLSKEEIVKIKSIFKADDLSKFTKEEIEEWNLLDKSSINTETLLKYSFDEILSKGLFKRVESIGISSIISLYGKFGYRVIDYLKENKEILNQLSHHPGYKTRSDYDFYKEYILGEKKPKSLYDLEIGSKWSDNDKYDYYKTLFRILWFKDDVNKMIDKETSERGLFHKPEKDTTSNRDKGIKNVLGSLDDYVYTSTIRLFIEEFDVSVDDFIVIILNGSKVRDYLAKLIEYCNIVGKETDNIRDIYFKKVMSYKIEDYELSTYKKILTDEQYEKVLQEKENQNFRSELSYFKPYDRKCNKRDSEEFYKKWSDYLKRVGKLPSGVYHDSYRYLNIVLIYTRVDKLDELSPLGINFKSYGGQELVKYINEIITGTFRTNGGMTEKLTEDECRRLYKWMTSQDLKDLTLSRYSSKEHPDGVYEVHEGDPRRYYLESMYLYDRNGFDEYMTYYASNVKYNVRKDQGFSMTGILPRPGDKTMYTTIRPHAVAPMIGFFESDRSKKGEDWLSEYKDIVKEMISWNLSIKEISYLLDWIKNDEVRKLLIDELVRKKASPKTVHKYMHPKRSSRW